MGRNALIMFPPTLQLNVWRPQARKRRRQSSFRWNRKRLVPRPKTLNVTLIYPIHPRAKKHIEAFGLSTGGITLVDPFDYLAFCSLKARLSWFCRIREVFRKKPDSGRAICHVGDNTERPEAVTAGSNVLVDTSPEKILDAAKGMSAKERDWTNPFGDGKSAQKIVNLLEVKLALAA
jgi:UDP-N-acetylglucosamine 2-epimerase (non-hydrolysing)